MENNNKFHLQFVITEQHDGRFYGRIPEIYDAHGNKVDCLQPTPELALKSLLEQLEGLKQK